MVMRSPEFDKGFRDELERMGVIPPLVTPAPPPPRPMPKQRPAPKPAAPRPVPPLVAGSTSKGITAPPRSVLTPGLIVQQSRPSSPPPATPTAAETTTPPPATPTPVVQPPATPVATPATVTPVATSEPVRPTPTDTPIATPETPSVPASTPHTPAASQMGVAVPEGSTEAAPTPEGYRQVRTPDGSLWVVDAQGRLARPGSLTRPAPLGNTSNQQSVEATLTTPDARITEAASLIDRAQSLQARPRATYASDAEYETAQQTLQRQIDASRQVIADNGAQTTAATDISTQNTTRAADATSAAAYRTTPIESGPYQGATIEQLEDQIFVATNADRDYQNQRVVQPGDVQPGVSITGTLGMPVEAPEGYTAEEWAGLVADAPPVPPGWNDTPERWAYAVFTGRMLNQQGINLNDDNWLSQGIGFSLNLLDTPRGWNVGGMGDDVFNRVSGNDRSVSRVFTAGILPGEHPINTWADDPANAADIIAVHEGGYTAPDGTHYTGGRAVWEFWASTQNRLTLAWSDILLDPLTFIELLSGGGGAAVRAGDALEDVGGFIGVAGRLTRTAGRAAQIPGAVIERAPDAVLGTAARVGVGILRDSSLDNRLTRAAGTGVRRGIGWLRDPSTRTVAETGAQDAAAAGARVYDATGRVAPPPGLSGPVAPEASVAPANRVRFVTPTTPAGQTPTNPETRIVADVSTTSRPRHVVFRNEDGTDTIVPVGQGATPNADTTTRPRHIVVRTADGQETEFALPNVDTTNRPIRVVIQHADGTETIVPPEMALAPNADVTARPRPVPTQPAPLATVPGQPVSTSPPRAPLPAAIPTSPPAGTTPEPATALPSAPEPSVPAPVRPEPQPYPHLDTSADDPFLDAPDPVRQTIGDRILTNRDFSLTGRARWDLTRAPEGTTPYLRTEPLPANPTPIELAQANNYVRLVGRYVTIHGPASRQATEAGRASLRDAQRLALDFTRTIDDARAAGVELPDLPEPTAPGTVTPTPPEATGSPVRFLTPDDPSAAPVAPQATPQTAPDPIAPASTAASTRTDPVTSDPTSIGGQTLARVQSSGEPIPAAGNASRPAQRATAAAARRQQLIDYNAAARQRRTEQVAARRAGEPVPDDLPPFQYQPDSYTTPTPDSFEDTPGGYSRYGVVSDEDQALLGKTFVRTGNPAYGQTVGATYQRARREIDELQRTLAADAARPGSLSSRDLKRIKALQKTYGDVGLDTQGAERAAERYLVDRFLDEAGLEITDRSRFLALRAWRGFITWTSRNLVSNILDAPRRLVGDFLGDSLQLAITGNVAAIPTQLQYGRDAFRATREGTALMQTPYGQRLRGRGITSRQGGYTRDFVANDRSSLGQLERVSRERRGGPIARMNTFGRDWINAMDSARRLSTAEGVWRREAGALDKTTLGTIVRLQKRYGVDLTPDDWSTTLRQRTAWGSGDYDATELYHAIRTRLLEDGTLPTDRAHRLSDEIARDYQSRVLALHEQSVAEVNRALFKYQYTRADQILGEFFAFHYYQSRAMSLYARQAIKHPALASNYYRMMEGIENYGEENGFPASLQGFARILNGPFGFAMFVSPTAFFDAFNYARLMASESGDETAFERLLNFPLVPGMNVPLSTLVNLAGYTPNALAPDPTGLTQERQLATAVINRINATVNDAGSVIGDPISDGMSWLRSETSGYLPGTERINSQDSTDYADSQVRALVIDAAEAEYGIPWDQFSDEQRAAVTAAQWDPSSPWYQTAYDRWSSGNLILEAGQQFTPAQPRGRITTDTEIRAAANPQGDIAPDDPYDDERGDLIPSDGIIAKRQGLSRMAGDEIGATQPLTPEESRLYQRQQTAYDTRDTIDAGSEEAATLQLTADGYQGSTAGTGPTGQGDGALDIWIYVAYSDDITGPITVQGRTYTPERIAELTQDERFALADGLIDEFDLTADLEDARAAQDAYVAEHPEYAVFQEWAGRVRDYAGPGGAGIAGYWADATSSNPAAAAYYEDLQQRYGDEIPEAMLASTDAYLATRGVQLDRFDGNPPETDNGRPGGADPSVAVGTNLNAPTATAETASYGPDTPADVVENLLQAEAEYTADMATFDEFSEQTYGARFDELSPYAQDSVTALMRNAGIETPSPSGLLREYAEWQQRDLAAGGDGSRDRFAAWRIQQKATEDEAIAPWYRDAGLTSGGDMLPAAD